MNFLSYKSVKDLMRTLVKDVKQDLEQAINIKLNNVNIINFFIVLICSEREI